MYNKKIVFIINYKKLASEKSRQRFIFKKRKKKFPFKKRKQKFPPEAKNSFSTDRW